MAAWKLNGLAQVSTVDVVTQSTDKFKPDGYRWCCGKALA